MPNTNPQAISVANTKIRPTADRFGQLNDRTRFEQRKADYRDLSTITS